MPTIIKNTENVLVTLENIGYVIRLKNHQGATFTIDENMNVIIGQNTIKCYSERDWKLINKEIEYGKEYMAAVKGQTLIKKPAYISSKNLVNNTMYVDDKGKAILFIGEGRFANGMTVRNREGCKYLCIKFQDVTKVLESYCNGGIIFLTYNDEHNLCIIDSYATKPVHLVKEIIAFPSYINTFVISNQHDIQYEFQVARM